MPSCETPIATDIPPAMNTPPMAERAVRTSVLLAATIEQFGGDHARTHKVRDLSSGGVRVDQGDALRKGATVVITVGSLEAVPATVVWIADGWAGLKFATVIDPDQARTRAALKPKQISNHKKSDPSPGPTAGWAGDLRNPYRR
ncbi:hypothetical protein GCM10008023_42260 [Sphingomonas glacialis]|uniref:PilZ domain-containing protein n=1 Tax=Sphingomonas glacialis TaxID=658225 RepID=A0ABQ3LVE6_9SPHN|nr:hypothetical protein GCM10008023_42260 [Sphingomonas glacialis]